ncbi:MAG TPA: PAS domain-containing protein [Microthrixaceae bacterium]|nr:PAS domain-containing protein [Microthrixaceae bacterium]
MSNESPESARTDSNTLGGDPACWAHLLEEPPVPPSDAALARLLAELADGVIICDPDGRIIFWNKASTRIFGWAQSEVLGKSLDLIIPERLRKRHGDGYARVMRTGHTDYGDRLLEVPALHHDGQTISIAFTVSLLTTEGAIRPSGIAAIIRDDTDRRREMKDLRARVGTLGPKAG